MKSKAGFSSVKKMEGITGNNSKNGGFGQKEAEIRDNGDNNRYRDLWAFVYYSDFYNDQIKRNQKKFNEEFRLQRAKDKYHHDRDGMRGSSRISEDGNDDGSKVRRMNGENVLRGDKGNRLGGMSQSSVIGGRREEPSGIYDGRIVELRKRYVNLWNDIEDMIYKTNTGLKQLPPVDLNYLDESLRMKGYSNNKYGYRLHEDDLFQMKNNYRGFVSEGRGPNTIRHDTLSYNDSNVFDTGRRMEEMEGKGNRMGRKESVQSESRDSEGIPKIEKSYRSFKSVKRNGNKLPSLAGGVSRGIMEPSFSQPIETGSKAQKTENREEGNVKVTSFKNLDSKPSLGPSRSQFNDNRGQKQGGEGSDGFMGEEGILPEGGGEELDGYESRSNGIEQTRQELGEEQGRNTASNEIPGEDR